MTRRAVALAAVLLLATTVLAGCGHGSAPVPAAAPASLVDQPDSDLPAVVVAQGARLRIGIRTTRVTIVHVPPADSRPGTPTLARLSIPYSAVVYDHDGSTWTFVRIAESTYLRQRITVLDIDAATAVLSRGPTVGTLVVSQGAPELLGVEYDISGEE